MLNASMILTLLIAYHGSVFASEQPPSFDDQTCEEKLAVIPDSFFAPFPNPSKARTETRDVPLIGHTDTSRKEGFLTNTVPLTVENVLIGYRHSIFPFIEDQGKIHWFTFAERGVLDFADVQFNKSTRKTLRSKRYSVTMNENFRAVIEACGDSKKTINAANRSDGDWITSNTINLYLQLHELGYAHSVEVWSEGSDGKELAGGLYGVLVDGVFFGESIFTRKSEAGRLAVMKLVEFLSEQGLTWLDLQMVTEPMRAIGGKEISRAKFVERLRKNQANPIHFTTERRVLNPEIK